MNSKKRQIYTAVIIGAGRIASGFDGPKSRHVLTHAHAITRNPRLHLLGITDVNAVSGKKEAEKWKIKFCPDIDQMFDTVKPDIVVIATPDSTHTDLLMRTLKSQPRLIICEKPVASSMKDMSRIEKTARMNIPVIINFKRRFDPAVVAIREEIISGKYGKVLSANGVYTKGILHNGSHMIDLARYFFGEMMDSTMHFRIKDFPEGEPTLGGVATFERCPQFYLMNGDERAFSLFEFEITTEKKRIRFVDEGFGLVTQDVIADPLYKGYQILGKQKRTKTGLISALPSLMKHVVNVLDGKERALVTIDDALRTQRTCFQLLAEFKK